MATAARDRLARTLRGDTQAAFGQLGNTLDRWYHRAAVIVWPRKLAFANRAESSPAWALDEIAAMASAGDVPGARAAAATLAPFWDTRPGRAATGGQGEDLRPGTAGSGRRGGRGCTPRAAPPRRPRSDSLTWRGSGSPRTSAPG